MAHYVQVLVTRGAGLAEIKSMWSQAKEREVLPGIFLIPLTDALVVEMTGKSPTWPGLDETDGPDPDGSMTADVMEALGTVLAPLKKVALRDEVALLLTQYFGGVGGQTALLLRGGDVARGPLLGDHAINMVLSDFGVERQSGRRDEFEAIGLGRWRRTNDILA
jgi:hypothetical protein